MARLLNLRVVPNASKNEIEEFSLEKGICKVRIKAPPEKGRANKELVKFLSKQLRKRVEIVSGFKSRVKRIRISDSDSFNC